MEKHQHCHHDHAAAGSATVADPVCGMQVDPQTTAHHATHDGQDYHFCSARCQTRFAEDPDRWLNGAAEEQSAPEGAVWTCPMHPELRQDHPGSCPICGMALEPEMVDPDAGPNEELLDITRRFWIGLALTLPVFLLEMGGHLFPAIHHLVPMNVSVWVQLALATPVVLWAGWPFFTRAVESVTSRNLNMFTLIALGTGVAWSYSIVATLAPGLFPDAFRAPDGTVAVYFEAAAVITVLVLLGQVLELRARERTSGALKALLGLAAPEVESFDSPTGKGAMGRVEGSRVLLGNSAFLKENGIDPDPASSDADLLRQDGATAILIAIGDEVAGVIAIADAVKSTTPEALKALRAEGIRVLMLTGDNRTTAVAVARSLGIDEVEADVLPDRKSAVVERLRAQGHVVTMAGDGVNDAPALAAADVGIAMGSGTDVAIESAGITLLNGELTGIARARTLSSKVMSNIRQNLVFAFGYNALGVPVAAGVLYPHFGILLSPVIAAAAMSLSSVSVIGNALRLKAAQL